MTTANPTYDYGYKSHVGSNVKSPSRQGVNVKRQEQLNSKDKRKVAILTKDRKTTVTAIFLIGIILISAVVVSAYTANLKYQNNELIAANEELQDEVDMLNIEIQTATNLSNVEKIAREKYGMEYADSSQYVYLTDKDAPTKKFASTIKNKAYN